ncbi:hypothetical protein ABLO27_25385 [Roseibium sp. SCPC15]|uniref:hypothetical protein n=1 Tax=Roseibium sp. SCP15 TaxID=3141376 RepID=UPI00333C6968
MKEPAAVELTDSLAAAGFLCLGGFEPGPDDLVPDRADGCPVKSLLLIGSTGPSLWPFLSQSPEHRDGKPDPLDRYTRRVLWDLATGNGFDVLFPFDGPPYHPFQQWALRCGGFSQSPLGVLAHTDYGPWTGFRAAFLSSDPESDAAASLAPGPCETCHDKPCLGACPVDAITMTNGYDVPKCRYHLRLESTTECWSGCLARQACPFGTEHRQDADTANLHMKSFIGLTG